VWEEVWDLAGEHVPAKVELLERGRERDEALRHGAGEAVHEERGRRLGTHPDGRHHLDACGGICGLASGLEEEHVEEEHDHTASPIDPLTRIRVHGESRQHVGPEPPQLGAPVVVRHMVEHGADVADREHDLGHLTPKPPPRWCSSKSSSSVGRMPMHCSSHDA
jgi:hypothetical protein